MANNINELYDTLSDDPLFLANFKSSGDLEKYLQNADNVKEFKKVYGSELDEAQLMGLKKKKTLLHRIQFRLALSRWWKLPQWEFKITIKF
jgi:hypothetical protein